MKQKKLPKTLAACADLLYKTREARYLLQRQAEGLEALETQLKERFIMELPKSLASGIAGRTARVQLSTKLVPRITEDNGGWPKFYKYVAANQRFDLLQRRLSEGAIKTMWEEGEEVPGVEQYGIVQVSCTAIKKGGK